MTLPVDLYPWFAVTSSVAILGLFTAHALDAAHAYRAHPDDRAARDLLIALTLTVASVGLLASASAAFLDALGFAGRAELRNLGLGLVRGALLTTAIVLFLIDRTDRRMRRPKA